MIKIIKCCSFSLFVLAGCHHAIPVKDAPFKSAEASPDAKYLDQDYCDTVLTSGYWKILASAREPSMRRSSFTHDAGTFAIRFTWIRVNHRPVFVRVWCVNGRYYIKTLQLEGSGVGLETLPESRLGSSKVNFSQLRPLTESEASEFKKMCSKSLLLNPLNFSEERLFEPGLDGARWILDSRLDSQFMNLDLYDLNVDYTRFGLDLKDIRDLAPLRAICLWLISASGLTIPAHEIY